MVSGLSDRYGDAVIDGIDVLHEVAIQLVVQSIKHLLAGIIGLICFLQDSSNDVLSEVLIDQTSRRQLSGMVVI